MRESLHLSWPFFSACISFVTLFCTSCEDFRRFGKKSPTSPSAAQAPDKTASFTGVSQWRRHFTDPHLQSLTDKALENNRDLKIALQRIEMAKAQITAARSALAPKVSGTAGAGLQRFGLYTMDGAGNSTSPIYDGRIIPRDLQDYSVGLQSSWELDIWGKLRSKRSSATARMLATVEGRNLVQTQLISELATAYYELVALDAEIINIDETIKLQKDALETVQIQKQAGAANELAIQQFEALLYNLQGMRLDTQQQIVQQEGVICSLLGDPKRPVMRNRTSLHDAHLPQLSSSVPADLLKNRPDIRRAEFELVAAKADVKAARAAFLPSVSINGVLGLQAFRSNLLLNAHSATYSAVGGLVAPLINRRAIQAEFDHANAQQLEALNAYQQSIVNGYVEVHNQLAFIRILKDLQALKSKEVQILIGSVSTATDLFRTRRATYLEVLNAQQNALKARLQLIGVMKRQFQVQANLYRALGGG
ncbi:efflux transporter outer membrane subunit [Prosthecobacter vanneervenii]|uniref:NodT family efflux transporter outer membrane factor (OMF) lipoprotein n=1 Tax=Prosthecobacter vanneervenii TaxID=48466 RepID=A0A7W7YEG6_9BACT|nr:efflux transporter outer membrane subunit [Prosthecobacter vanneervenii]MBB5034693.1 NodT family efflux transporter outer membrane factor (OMF) lipoprotein [Prosthecobacter vanneervenii]